MDDKLHTKQERALEMAKHAEVQAFLYVLLLMKLIDDGDLKNVSVSHLLSITALYCLTRVKLSA